ncbi:tetratricopeptide repeat protein [Nonomuraea cavernae]|uniref:tetratricopeptide repeat protein n=1 Tax=Nonomuraea cavernae TaxID=2045107 RepID=UPI0034059DE9
MAGQVVGDCLEALAASLLDVAGLLVVAGVRGFEAGLHAHAARPALGQGEQAGDVGGAGAGPWFAFGGDRWGPGVGGDLADRSADGLGDVEADGIEIDQLLAGPRALKEGRELFVLAGWLSEILAWLAHDLGNPLTAWAYAVDCFEHADQAGHDELCGWAVDAMASIALHADRPERAVSAAVRGLSRVSTSHPLAVRLHAQASRGQARLGNHGGFEEHFAKADRLWNTLPGRTPSRPDGIETGPLATYAMTAYTASSYIWLGEYELARRHAESAVKAHENVPDSKRSPSREAIARLDLGIALANLGAVDEAVAAGVAALDSPRVVASVRARAADLDLVLATTHPQAADEFRARLAVVGQGAA